MAFEWIESHGSNQKARLERFESHGSNHMTQKAQFASNRLNRLNRFDLRPDIGPEITLKHVFEQFNNSKYVHFVSPGHHFVLVAGDLESFATFLQPHNCNVGEANLICGCKYLRHGRTAGELGGLTGSGGQLVVGRLGVMTSWLSVITCFALELISRFYSRLFCTGLEGGGGSSGFKCRMDRSIQNWWRRFSRVDREMVLEVAEDVRQWAYLVLNSLPDSQSDETKNN